MLGVKRVDDPRNFGVAEIEEDGFISRVVEKPAIPKAIWPWWVCIRSKKPISCSTACIKFWD